MKSTKLAQDSKLPQNMFRSNQSGNKSVTWNKDSHGLFDYQSKSYNQNKFRIDSTTAVFRNEKSNQVNTMPFEEKKIKTVPEMNRMLTVVSAIKSPGESNYLISQILAQQEAAPQPVQEEKNEPYLVVRSLKNSDGDQKGYNLAVNDVIKLGRMEYTVLEIQTQKQHFLGSSDTIENMFDKQFDTQMIIDKKLQGQCKVCLMDTEEQDNFLCSPCKCKGSCQTIHLKCLQKWMDSKIKKKSVNFVYLLNFKKFKCEICQQTLPNRLIKDGVCHLIFEIKRPQNNPYIIIQSSQNKSQKNLYILEASSEVIKIGRGHTCQVRITDISVSRTHAHIKYADGKFSILDNNSKFGTLIKLRNNIPITWDKVAIQVGRTVLTLVLRNKQSKEKSKTLNNFSLSASNIKPYIK